MSEHYEPKNFRSEFKQISREEVIGRVAVLEGMLLGHPRVSLENMLLMNFEIFQLTYGEEVAEMYDDYVGEAKSDGRDFVSGEIFLATYIANEMTGALIKVIEAVGCSEIKEHAAILSGMVKTLMMFSASQSEKIKAAKKTTDTAIKKAMEPASK